MAVFLIGFPGAAVRGQAAGDKHHDRLRRFRGRFSPSLFLGATLGAAFGNFVLWAFPALGISPAVYTIAGMAAVVGGSTGAVLTSIVMTFEQTRDYSVMLPIILTVSIAHIVRVRICPESIYTLSWRGAETMSRRACGGGLRPRRRQTHHERRFQAGGCCAAGAMARQLHAG